MDFRMSCARERISPRAPISAVKGFLPKSAVTRGASRSDSLIFDARMSKETVLASYVIQIHHAPHAVLKRFFNCALVVVYGA
ncbi:hypothetical protein BRAS3843_1490017 [Bradyrhizobium sp. STM 3843]|nr:hypothetical protein BRAS3843_1490017 [Bradyrhizobium sp. STM 3843]